VQHYDRAPIAEAVIDIQAALKPPPSLRDLEKFSGHLRDRLPLMQAINSFAVNFAADSENGGIQSNASAAQLGYRLSSETNDRILQVRKNGVAYSHMPPYSNWEQFLSEVRPLWDLYSNTFAIESLTRLAVRFINRLQVQTGVDVDSYLTIGPRIPDAVSTHVTGFFTQLVLPVMALGPEYKTIINVGIEPGTAPDSTGLLLDIDVFREQSSPLGPDQLWHELELLRQHKNKVFEASITDKVREMIK
jgi:uncharacterized protein (TIGR04255 family)